MNYNSVSMHFNSVRGNVFSFSGSNYLAVASTTPVISTKTFWLYSGNATSGSVFSSPNYPVSLNMNSHLISTPSYLSSNNHTWSCSSIQGSAWNFYAITVTATNNFIYINGNPTPCGGGSQLGVNFNGDTTEIEFGANMGRNFYSGLIDDMRLYPYILSSVEMATIYSGTGFIYCILIFILAA
jgi:hypothetical protein